ncbi:hypothetical protein [Desulfonatronovibrio magnus]|uniref:hypothetical protein n=1 Tax=Desulfonatronovibrio magnus TaxID=698827 RepID=UPI0012F893AB|nr:hypothetical protein [Desulfonatronovibrio magnus]
MSKREKAPDVASIRGKNVRLLGDTICPTSNLFLRFCQDFFRTIGILLTIALMGGGKS